MVEVLHSDWVGVPRFMRQLKQFKKDLKQRAFSSSGNLTSPGWCFGYSTLETCGRGQTAGAIRVRRSVRTWRVARWFVWGISLVTQDFLICEAYDMNMSKKEEVSPFPLIEPGKNNIPSFKDQGCDVRSVGRSSRSMRQAVACSVWEIFCNEMN